MLPYIVISAAIIFFLLQRSGIFDLPKDGTARSERRRWGRRIIQEIEQDPELNQRLEIFKDFLDGQQDEEQ